MFHSKIDMGVKRKESLQSEVEEVEKKIQKLEKKGAKK